VWDGVVVMARFCSRLLGKTVVVVDAIFSTIFGYCI
jgi:hypothetical protein